MVIVKIMGGLGNQIFQYSAGRQLAYNRQTDLLLDLNWFNSQSLQYYRLDNYSIRAKIAHWSDLKIFISDKFYDRVNRKMRSYFTPLFFD